MPRKQPGGILRMKSQVLQSVYNIIDDKNTVEASTVAECSDLTWSEREQKL